MLPRILEPEVMDSPDEARDYDAMDHATVNRIFITDFLAAWNQGSPILDVGTGTAQIPIEFSRQSAHGEIVAIDLAENMLEVGRQNVVRAGCSHRVRLEKINARLMPYADAAFQSVMSNSIVHHIPEPGLVFAEMVRVAAPGATLFVRDLLRPADRAVLESLVATYAGDANAHQRQMFADSLHAALTISEVRDLIAALGFDPATAQPTSDRHWTWCARKH